MGDVNNFVYLNREPPYPSIAVANTLFRIARDNHKKIDPLKLQKLLYYAHGWHLAFYNKPLLDEAIQAWQYGPVIQSVYNRFRIYSSEEIEEPAHTFVENEWAAPFISEKDILRQELLKEIWRVYGKLNGLQLSTLSHKEGTPWHKVWTSSKEVIYFQNIPNDEIKQHFDSLNQEQ